MSTCVPVPFFNPCSGGIAFELSRNFRTDGFANNRLDYNHVTPRISSFVAFI